MSLKLKTIVTALVAVFAGINAVAQNGSIAGVVTEKDNGSAVIGAAIMLDSNKVAAITDFDGKYKVSVKPGTYTVTCKALGLAPGVVKNIVVQAGKQSLVDIQLSGMVDTLGTAIIWGDRPLDAQGGAVQETKEATQTEDIKTAEEMKKTFTGDASGVARTMPGVTLVDNRFVVIRGLSERYNAVLLNNVFAPSVESDVKTFSFDLIPTQMLDRFTIYKSPSADLPGEFSGGAVRLTTRNIPEANSLQIGYSVGYRAGTTFEPFSMNRGGSADLFGFGAGSRNLGSSFPVNLRDQTLTPQQLLDATKSLPNSWNHTTSAALPDQRFNATWSVRKSMITKNKKPYQFGNITSLSYSSTNQAQINKQYDYNVFDPQTGQSDTIFAYGDTTFQNRVRVALIQNNAVRFGKAGQHSIELKNLLNQLGDNETILRGGPSFENGEERKEYSYRYSQRLIYTGQLSGEHSFNNDKTKVDWTLAYSTARRNEPDWRRARYSKAFGSADSDPFFLYIPNQAVPFYLGRLHISMREDVKAATANIEQVITLGDSAGKGGYTFTLKGGTYIEDKIRGFGIRNLGYRAASFQTYGNIDLLTTSMENVFAEANLNTTNGVLIDEDTKRSDVYVATNNLRAGYLMAVLPFGEFKARTEEILPRMKVSGGVRVEQNIQKLFSYRSNNIGDSVRVNNDITSVLPSVNVAINATDRFVVRLAYGKTINRPEFREIAPLTFYDFVFNSIYQGNDSLKTPSINNFDLRFELYPRFGENITLGLFYKQFNNPIELYFFPGLGSGGVRGFTWGNALQANNFGAELEIRKRLDSIGIPIIRNLGIVANAAYIYSDIKLSENDTVGRPMMGQSPYVVNVGLFWTSDSTGWQVNAAYNVVGPRIIIAGVPSLQIPDIYEMPRHQLDLSVVKTVGKRKNIDLRVNASDILNMDFLLLQDANADGKLDRSGDQQIQSFRRGAYFTFGINVRLLEPESVTK
jgi:TonB-dependent receptor